MVEEKSVWDVSRQSFDLDAHRKAAEDLGIAIEPATLPLKNDKGVVVKTIDFVKVLFQKPVSAEDTPADRFERATKFFELLQPPAKDRENNPLDILAAHLTNSMDLTMRNGIRSSEKAVLEGPDKAIMKSAKQMAAHLKITEDEALQRTKAAWGVA